VKWGAFAVSTLAETLFADAPLAEAPFAEAPETPIASADRMRVVRRIMMAPFMLYSDACLHGRCGENTTEAGMLVGSGGHRRDAAKACAEKTDRKYRLVSPVFRA
jgi:hypothetical protein